MINVQSPITPFGLKAASAITNLKHEAAPQELPGQPAEKKQRVSVESALKMKEAASALSFLARSSDSENEAPPKFAMGLSAQKSAAKKTGGIVSIISKSITQKKKVAVAPTNSAQPSVVPTQRAAPPQSNRPPMTPHQVYPHHPPPPVLVPSGRANPLGWMWPNLPMRPPHMFGCFPSMHHHHQQPHMPPQPIYQQEPVPPVRYQRRPVKPKSEWTEDDDQRREQAKTKKQAWTLASHAPAAAPTAAPKEPVVAAPEPMEMVQDENEPVEVPQQVVEAAKAVEVAKLEENGVEVTDIQAAKSLKAKDIPLTAESIKQELMAAYPSIRKKRTTWSDDEDERLKSIVAALDPEGVRKCNWTDVARYVLTVNDWTGYVTSWYRTLLTCRCFYLICTSLMPERDSKQCRDRWLNHLDPALSKHANSPWTVDEDRKLIMFIKKHGTRWRLMQLTILPNRSELTIKNRWNSSMKRRYTRYLSDKWNVSPNSIQLLNAQGLLHPGVSVDQMLEVAQGNIVHVSKSFGEPMSDRSELVIGEINNKTGGIVKEMVDKLNNESAIAKSANETPAFVRIYKTKMSDENVREELGVIEIPQDSCFATTRATLFQRFGLDSTWKFSLPEFGIITAKQELDLGSMAPLMKRLGLGHGSKAQPVELSVVEQA